MKRSGKLRWALLAGLVLVAAPVASQSNDARATADRMAARLVAKLTLDEKLDQLVNVAPAIQRLDIPAYNWWTESLHGALGRCRPPTFPNRSAWQRPSMRRSSTMSPA